MNESNQFGLRDQAISARLRSVGGNAPPRLKTRVMQAVADEIRKKPAKQSNHWPRLAAAAAVAVVTMNLTIIIALVTSHRSPPPAAASNLRQIAAEIRSLDRSLTPDDARRFSVLLQSGDRITPVPIVQSSDLRVYTGSAIRGEHP